MSRDRYCGGAHARGPLARPRPATHVADPDSVAADGVQAGRVAVPNCAVHARSGGRVLPPRTDAWSSLGDPGSSGERLSPDDIWIPRVARKDLKRGVSAPGPPPLDTDLLHCHLLGRPPGPGQVTRGLTVVGWFWKGCYEPAPRPGVTRKCACGWNLRDAARRHDGADGPARGTVVPTGDRLKERLDR
jgi:hypothetical protein